MPYKQLKKIHSLISTCLRNLFNFIPLQLVISFKNFQQSKIFTFSNYRSKLPPSYRGIEYKSLTLPIPIIYINLNTKLQ